MHPISEQNLRALLTLAGIQPVRVWQLAHSYFPYREGEDLATTHQNALYRAQRPSWLVKIPQGLLQFDLRKRVVEINWSETPARIDMPTDNTKASTYVHAYTEDEVLQYLRLLRIELDRIQPVVLPKRYA